MVILFVLKTVTNWLVPIISSVKYKGVLGIIKDDIILIYIKKRNENILLLFFCKHTSYIVYYINANKTALVFDNNTVITQIQEITACNKEI